MSVVTGPPIDNRTHDPGLHLFLDDHEVASATKITPEEKREVQYYSLYQVWPRWALYQIHVFDGDPALAVTGLCPYHGEDRRAGTGQQRDRQVPVAVHGRRAAQGGRPQDQHAGTVLENVDLFITGRRPMDEWDDFIKEVKSAGATDLEVIYNRTYNFKVKR